MEDTQNKAKKDLKKLKNTKKKNNQPCGSHKGKTLKKYSIATKIEAVQAAKELGNRPAARLFGVDEKRIRDWRKQEQSFEHQSLWSTRLPGAGRKGTNKQLEAQLGDFVRDKLKSTTNGHRLTADTIAREARRIWSELVKQDPALGKIDFKASKSYVAKFMDRFNNPAKHRKTPIIPPNAQIDDDEEEDGDGEEVDMSSLLEIELDS